MMFGSLKNGIKIRMTIKINDIKCALGIHNWDYSENKRYCLNCHKIELIIKKIIKK